MSIKPTSNNLRVALNVLLWGSLFLATEAQAQQAFPAPTQLTVKIEDENSVDVLAGTAHFPVQDAGIGDLAHVTTVVAVDATTEPEPSGYYMPPEHDNFVGGMGYTDNRDFARYGASTWTPRPSFQIRVAGIAATFYVNSDYSIQSLDGSTLTGSGVNSWVVPGGGVPSYPAVRDTSQGTWTLTARDGTAVAIDTSAKPYQGFSKYIGVATSITYPSGRIVRMNYTCGGTRLQSVTRNDGLMLKYVYADSSCGAQRTNVIAINTAYQYCDPFADSCTVDASWRRSQYAYTYVGGRSVYNVTDQRGVLSRFTLDKWNRVLSYKPPGQSSDLMTFQYCQSYFTGIVPGGAPNVIPTLATSEPGKADADEVYCGEYSAFPVGYWTHIYNRITRATRATQSWFYTLPTTLGPGGSPFRQYKINRPLGLPTYVNIDTQPGGGLVSYLDPVRAMVYYTGNETQRIDHGQVRGQPAQTYTYDARGNILSDGISTANYDTTCANAFTCNQPTWVRDTAGNEADFSYASTHGGVLTKTLPADASGVHPQTRYTYVQRYAWFLNSSSVMTRSTEPIWLLATESYCRTGAPSGAGCAIAGDEVVTTYDYGPDSGPNNLWLRGTAVTADGQTLRTCYGYNKFGDKVSQTSPRAGLAVCP